MSRRIHIEGEDAAWNKRRPSAPYPTSILPASAAEPPPTTPLSDAADEARLAKNAAETRQRIAELQFRINSLDNRLVDLSTSEAAEVGRAVAEALERAEQRRVTDSELLAARHAGERARLTEAIVASVNIVAPGIASADWAGVVSAPPEVARFARFGRMRVDDLWVPAVTALIGSAGWFVEGNRSMTDPLIRSTIGRIVGQVPLKRLVLTVFDPRARGALGQFAPLRQAAGASFPAPTSNVHVLVDRLGDALDGAMADSELIISSGYADLIDQWRSAPIPEGTLQIVVVLDYPYGITDEAQAQLLRIAAAEGPVRPCLLVAGDSAVSGDLKGGVEPLRHALRHIEGADGRWTVGDFPLGVKIMADEPPTEAEIDSVVAQASERSKSDSGASFALAELLGDDLNSPWEHDSTESLDVVIGKIGRGQLGLSLRTENPPHPNALIGGAVGTGKSNLLLDIVYGLATRYAPDQLEFHLLDFKRGVEFARFGPDKGGANWLPHVRTLGLESDRSFGLAVLRSVDGELARRADLFRSSGTSSINEYRAEIKRPMSRVVLIIDEFHVLFGGDDEHVETTVEIFDRLARQGRSHGVHLLVASQTTSGVAALAVKGESIFAQFPIRISLKNTAAESEAILSPGNKAAAELTYRGEVVFNANMGLVTDAGNQRGIVAHAASGAMAELQRRLWERGHGDPPLMFYGSEYAGWPATSRPVTRGGLTVWVGRPIAISDEPRSHRISEDVDQAVAVLGKADDARLALRNIALSAIPDVIGGRIVVLNGEEESAEAVIAEIERAAVDTGVGFEHLDRDGSARWLRNTAALRLDDRATTAPLLIVGFSLQRLRDMEVEETPATDPDDFVSMEPSVSAREILAKVAHDGAKNRVFVVGSWANVRTMEADLGSYAPGVGLYVTAGLGIEDLRSIAGHGVRAVDGTPRLGIFDRSGAGRLEVVVPFSPDGSPEWAVP